MRSSGALWFVPVVFAIGVVLPLGDDMTPKTYIVSEISLNSVGIALSGPLLAGFAALSLRGRVRFHGRLRASRTGLTSLLVALWPLVVGAPLAACVAVLLSVREIPRDAVSWQLLAVVLLVMLACAAGGVGFGWALPSVVAVPGAAVLSFFWINYLPTYRYPTMHYLAPPLIGYSQDTGPDPLGTLAVATLAGLLVGGLSLIFLRRGWSRTRKPVAAVLVMGIPVIAVASSVGLLRASGEPLNLQVASPRTTDLQCDTRGGTEICLWPEAAKRVEQVGKLASVTNDVLARWGLPEIEVIGQGGLRRGAVNAEFLPSTTETRLQLALSKGYLRARLGCQEAPGPASEIRVAILAQAAGVPRSDLEDEFAPETIADVDRVMAEAESPQEIGRQYLAGLADIDCRPRG